ncbi:dTMP kinase [Segetibacter koreensis]|uniref:dTMP kinase n=1 Tax=Segetibacter koreensis TaxID=398037 RepID=UPI0003709CCD|nr:dTMP kinase [Segetibacter koreensis]
MRENLFIALEGIDGSGKSTQAKLLSQRLISMGHKVYTTFEPTDSPIGSIIRNIMKGRINCDHKTIAGLFVADRLDHLLNEVNGIVKKIEEGYTVITDRYYFSSYAYHGTHMNMDWVINANAMSAEILRPDINIFIDVLPETSMERLNNNRSIIELYETLENLQNVREKYFEAFDKLKLEENIFITNGNLSLDEVSNNIWNEIEKILKREKSYA